MSKFAIIRPSPATPATSNPSGAAESSPLSESALPHAKRKRFKSVLSSSVAVRGIAIGHYKWTIGREAHITLEPAPTAPPIVFQQFAGDFGHKGTEEEDDNHRGVLGNHHHTRIE